VAALAGVCAQLEVPQGAGAPQVCSAGHPHTGQCALRETADLGVQCAKGMHSHVATAFVNVSALLCGNCKGLMLQRHTLPQHAMIAFRSACQDSVSTATIDRVTVLVMASAYAGSGMLSAVGMPMFSLSLNHM